MLTIQQTLQTAQAKLNLAGLVDSPLIDAELLLCEALKVSRTYLFTWPEKTLTATQTQQFNQLLQLRLQGQPIAHILGQREFWGLTLQVTADTLIPRPDTETLIKAVLELNAFKTSACKILDLGTGSGAIALALKSEYPNCLITAVDQSEAALNIAKQNSQQLGLEVTFVASNWFSAVTNQQFHCIVSNPPYIEENDPHLKQGDVRFEPITALTSGFDGLDDIRLIIYQAWSFLEINGWLLIEHGYNQAQVIRQIFAEAGYQNITLKNDLGGNPRVSLAQKL